MEMDSNCESQKVAFLIEMFEDLDTAFIEKLVSSNSNCTLEQLVNQCLAENETKHQHQPPEPDTNANHDYAEMISLIPASTASYFDTDEDDHNENEAKQSILEHDHEEAVQTQGALDPDSNPTHQPHSHDALLDSIPKAYHIWFEPHLNQPDISKIIEIYTHLSLMTEQHRMQYDNHEYSNYNQIKCNELNACIKMMHTLMKNIAESPTVDKYRCIRESNKAFKKKLAHIAGSALLLKLCGWDYIANDGNSNSHAAADGLYVFNSTLPLEWIKMVAEFLKFYLDREILSNTNETTLDKTTQAAKIDDEFPIITDFPRKKLKPKNEKQGQQKRKLPKMHKLSAQEMREKRLKNLGNINDANYGKVEQHGNGSEMIGPIADKIMDLNAPNLRNELLQIGQKKHKKWLNSRQARKRIFTMSDLEQLSKEEFDRKARGPKTTSELDEIGKEALRLSNEFRKSQGLPPCQWHQALCDIGKVHSKNMSDGTVPFGHEGFHERVRQYPFRALSAAENVAMSKGLSNPARVAVNGWIESPGHRKNLLSNNNYCGIGVYRGYDGGYYLTQLFGLTNM
eukprot:CAMPEP_0197047308 /NCGR_PEP_ID=MMETSP1384-20130603/22829_1 /TAXON_ID=29189 /ORGANISM="Ammonia sp." /LENGTH=567 /DNA_ID=CAMNT_0042479213 /DNA_START=72 /DNA_END=1775 /DNA_ORIENTATION=-